MNVFAGTPRMRNWDVRLAKAMRPLIGQPFEWGRTDCGSLCRVALDALYGPGTAEQLLGEPWDGPRAALEAAATLSGPHGVLEALGAAQVHRSYASAGDFVTVAGVDDDGLPRLMWVVGPRYVRVTRVDGVVMESVASLPADAEVWRLP